MTDLVVDVTKTGDIFVEMLETDLQVEANGFIDLSLLIGDISGEPAIRAAADANLQTQINTLNSTKANLNAPSFGGNPTITSTPVAGANNFQIPNTTWVQIEIASRYSNASPLMNGAADAGTANSLSRADHVHPTDTTRAPITSPNFLGTPTAPTPSVGDNDTSIATTAFVQARLSYYYDNFLALVFAPLGSPDFVGTPTVPTPVAGDNTTQIPNTNWVQVELQTRFSDFTPLPNGTASPGVLGKLSRWDHIHPTDTTRAPIDSPAFLGDPTAPTRPIGDSGASLATTAFVQGELSPFNTALKNNINRPGENPGRFTNTQTGSPETRTPLPSAGVVVGTEGSSYRISGTYLVTHITPIWVLEQRSYKCRVIYRRAVDPTDPSVDNVHTGISWLDESYNLVTTQTVVVDNTCLIASGQLIQSFNLPTPPAGAVYARIYVKQFGTEGQLDVELIGFSDITDQAQIIPLYDGLWDASANSPALASGVGTRGHYRVVNVAGTTVLDGVTSWEVGDKAWFNGTEWEKEPNVGGAASINLIGINGITTARVGDNFTLGLAAPFSVVGDLTGSISGEYALNSIVINNDSAINLTGNTYGFQVKLTGSNSTKQGGRFAFGALADMITPGDPADVAGQTFYCGAILQGIARYDNSATGAVAKPAIYGGNSNVVALSNAKNWGAIVGHEIDMSTYAGADYDTRDALDIVLAGTGPQGAVRDAGIGFKAVPAVVGWKHLIVFDNLSGGSPIHSTGTVLGSVGAQTIGNGIDLSSCTISGNFLKSSNFSVSGAGAVDAASISTRGGLSFYKSTAPLNQKYISFGQDTNGNLLGYFITDTLTAPSVFLTINRSGAVAQSVVFGTKVYVPASAAGAASFNIPPGAAPTSPINGDIWETSAGLFARINGVTEQITTGDPTQFAKRQNILVFTSNGTYTPSAGMKTCEVIAFGGGGGGGSGALAAPGVAVSGGAGGGGGGRARGIFTAAQIGASRAVTIGAAGVGGAAQTTSSTNGNPGTAGGFTHLANLLVARGGGAGSGGQIGNPSGGGGAGSISLGGGNGTGAAAGTAAFSAGNGGLGTAGGNNSTVDGNGSGGAGSPASGGAGTDGGSAEKVGASGGGSGGGITTANAYSDGGYGGALYIAGVLNRGGKGVAGGTLNGGPGGTWANANGPLDQAGGGGGGGASDATAAGDGGAGGLGGGGGGGGGSSRDGGVSGKGGDAGAGLMIIIENF